MWKFKEDVGEKELEVRELGRKLGEKEMEVREMEGMLREMEGKLVEKAGEVSKLREEGDRDRKRGLE